MVNNLYMCAYNAYLKKLLFTIYGTYFRKSQLGCETGIAVERYFHRLANAKQQNAIPITIYLRS